MGAETHLLPGGEQSTGLLAAVRRWQNVWHVLALLSLFAFQSLQLDCDPSPLRHMHEFNDEGYWNHAARCKVLFGTFVPDEFNQGVIASPLFTLIQWAVFSVEGVSLHAARLLPLASLWLTILMVYFLMRRHTSANMALLAATMLGLVHEMLMFVKWSTPIITEGCLVVAVFFFWELAKTRGRWWAAAAAGSFVAAVLTTTLSLHCLPGILLFLGVAVFVRKEADRKQLAVFLAAAIVLTFLVAVGYYLPNHRQVQIFLQTVGRDNVSMWGYHSNYVSSSGGYPESRLLTPFFEPFGSPGVAPLMMILSLWLIDLLMRAFKAGVGPVLRQISSLELYCVCWMVGALPSILVTPYMPSRRFVIFLIPVVVIAVLFMGRVWRSQPGGHAMLSTPVAVLPRGYGHIVLWGIIVAAWCEYGYRCLVVLYGRWLAWTSSSISASPTNVAFVLLLAFVVVTTISGLYFLAGKTQLSLLVLLLCFFGINTALDLTWYSHATYTIRDASRELGRRTTPRQYLVDGWSWELSMENQCLPIFSPWYCYGKHMNAWFAAESDRGSFLLIRNEQFDGCYIRQDLFPYHFARQRVSEMPEIRLCPFIFAPHLSRYVGKLQVVRPLNGLLQPGRNVDGGSLRHVP
jgi:hypothetical protein